MSRSILKKTGPMRVPRDDAQVDTKDEVKESEEDQCQSAGGEAEASVSVPDITGEDRKDEPKKPFKNKNLKAKDSMRLSSNRLGSSPRSRFLQKRKESGGSPRLLKIKEGEHSFTYPESVKADTINIPSEPHGRIYVKDTAHGTDTVDIAQSRDSVNKTFGKDADHKTSKEDTVDRTFSEYPVQGTSGRDADHKTSKEDNVDRAPCKDTVHRTSSKDSDHKTSKEDTVDRAPCKDTVDKAPCKNTVHRTSGEDADHKTSKEDTVDRAPCKDTVHRTSGKDADHKTSKEDTVDRAPCKDTVHRTSGKDSDHKTSKEETADRAPCKDTVHRTSCTDAEHKTSKEDSIDPGRDPVDKTSDKDAKHKTSSEVNVDITPGRHPVHSSSGKDATLKASKEDTVDITPGKDPVQRSAGKDVEPEMSWENNVDIRPGMDAVHKTSVMDAEQKRSKKNIVDREPGKDPLQRSSCVETTHKPSSKNTASRTCRSDHSCQVQVPPDVEEKGQDVPHLHTTSVTKSPTKTQIEQQGMDVASAGGGCATEVLVRDVVVAEDQGTSSCGYLTSGFHDEADNPRSIMPETDNSSHVESEKYSKETMEVQALLKECPSPKDKIEYHVLQTNNTSPEHNVELRDRPAGNDGSKCDGEEYVSVVEHKPTHTEGAQTVTIVDTHPDVTFHTHADDVKDVLGDVPLLEDIVGVPVLPAPDPIPPNTEQVQGPPALELFQKDVKVEDVSDTTSQTSFNTVTSLPDGTDQVCHKENVIPSLSAHEMDNSVPEEFAMERSKHSNRKTDNTPPNDTCAHSNAEEDEWSFSDDECFV